MLTDDHKKPYILWVDYGNEGWIPKGFDNTADLSEYIENGIPNHWVVTKLMNFAFI